MQKACICTQKIIKNEFNYTEYQIKFSSGDLKSENDNCEFKYTCRYI